MIHDLTPCIRYAVRALLRTPAVSLTALLIMALGIGATTAIFSVANAVLFRPLPFADPGRLVEIGTVGILEFQAYREQSRSFEALVSWGTVNRNLDDAGGPERISAVAAERGLFDLLGVRPLAGRTFTPGDPADVAVVSEAFWRHRVGGTPSLNDWKIVLDRQPYTVIGVMPDSFQFPYRGHDDGGLDSGGPAAHRQLVPTHRRGGRTPRAGRDDRRGRRRSCAPSPDASSRSDRRIRAGPCR